MNNDKEWKPDKDRDENKEKNKETDKESVVRRIIKKLNEVQKQPLLPKTNKLQEKDKTPVVELFRPINLNEKLEKEKKQPPPFISKTEKTEKQEKIEKKEKPKSLLQNIQQFYYKIGEFVIDRKKEQARGEERDQQKKEKNLPLYFNTGGQAPAHRIGEPKGTDTIPAWLSPKEFVVNPESAVANKELLERINKAHGPLYLSKGGFVSSMFSLAGKAAKSYFDTQKKKAHAPVVPLEQQVEAQKVAALQTQAASGNVNAQLKLAQIQEKKDLQNIEAKEKKVELFKGDLGTFVKSVQSQAEGFKDLLTGSERAGDALGNFGKALGGGGGMFLAFMGDSIEVLRKWNDNLTQANFKFAEFSSSMAQVSADLYMKQVDLDIQRGERRAPSAQKHMESAFELEKRFADMEDALAIARNKLATVINKSVSSAMDKMAGSIAIALATVPWGKSLLEYLEKLIDAEETDMAKNAVDPEERYESYKRQGIDPYCGRPRRF